MTVVYQNMGYNEVCYKGTVLYYVTGQSLWGRHAMVEKCEKVIVILTKVVSKNRSLMLS